ncbi:hypothetical protein M011DRAFT_484877 [Sporormia fimetaria CBS 119925]|uniref:Uncharacterized protein n=1 Tax=Sporormia fimetaria CBS 119925 TaxID=1340428 RepID=A0A6A6VIU3_9PLEO|nr:hypothetical protein M011DRAFT_484877 [Sporormia fimetaria CBS 119925]
MPPTKVTKNPVTKAAVAHARRKRVNEDTESLQSSSLEPKDNEPTGASIGSVNPKGVADLITRTMKAQETRHTTAISKVQKTYTASLSDLKADITRLLSDHDSKCTAAQTAQEARLAALIQKRAAIDAEIQSYVTRLGALYKNYANVLAMVYEERAKLLE